MRLLSRTLIMLSLLLVPLPPVSGATVARNILAATPISRMDLPWWRARFEAKQVELRERPPNLIFLGDSITQNWERHGPPDWADYAPVWQRFYGDRDAINLGFMGDTTASLIWRIRNGELDGISPKVAVVLIGANNLGRVHWSAEDTVAGIAAIIAEVHRRLPRAKVLLLGVLPSDRTIWATETTVVINRTLAAKYAHDSVVTFIDVGHLFQHDGKLDRGLFYDPKLTPPEAPLHPTAQGMALMAAAMEPALAALMGDRNHLVPR
jgi:lysophospholipase L1-like esterase